MEVLIEEGVDAVKVLPLAAQLGVTRGSFYWHFKDREELLGELLSAWEAKNTQAVVRQVKRECPNITAAILNIFELWVEPRLFDPRLDFAVRAWARASQEVHEAVRAADEKRVEAIASAYTRLGYSEMDSLVRARILYFMQIGYYALNIQETFEQRMAYLESYIRGFSGQEPDEPLVQQFRERYCPSKV